MYQFDDIGSTFLSLPPNMQDIESDCFGYALDKQMEKFHKLAKQLTIWSDIDNVDPKYYDYMALCIKAPYYKSEYDNEMKLKLLKTAIEMHRYAGTQRAVDQLLEIIFERAIYTPWFEYDGQPYHFKPQVFDVLTEDAATVFADVVRKVKAARSVMDAIAIGREAFGTIFVGVATTGSIKGATIREENILDSEINMQCCTGATISQNSKGDKIREAHILKNSASGIDYTAIAATMAQKNETIVEATKFESSTKETVYTGAGIYSIQTKSTIKED